MPNTKRSRDELTEFRAQLAAQGAPDEVLRVLDGANDVEEALQRLAGAGLAPSPEDVLDGLLDGFSPLLERGCDSVEAELSGTEFLDILRGGVPEHDLPEMLAKLVDEAGRAGTPQALAMLRVLAVTGPTEVQVAAAEAADRLVAAGLKDRPWVRGLGSPKVGACFGYTDGTQSAMALTFTYGRKSHVVVALIDHDLGGGVKDCFIADRPDVVRAEYKMATKQFGVDFRDYTQDEARAILDRALANKPCPVEADQIEDVSAHLDLLRRRVMLLSGSPATSSASVYRVKITLRGAKPPIWRRVEVPSDITLDRLHHVIQAAFGWLGYHLWVFETDIGDYGVADRELGHRSAASKKLMSVASDRIRYTYDFGDEWVHEIVVEDVLAAEPGAKYPRAVTGRRACPPEDCGGMWGYQDLCVILSDPGHDEHQDRLNWLGLGSASEFDPAAFDVDAVNKRVAKGAKVLRKA